MISRIAAGVGAMLVCSAPITAWAQEQPVTTQEERLPASWEPQGLLREPKAIERAAIFADRNLGNGSLTNGFYIDSFNMIPGSGWIAAGPGYRHWYSNDSAYFDASASVSWRWYKTAQARFELPRLARSRVALGGQVLLQDFTQVPFFGTGPDTLEGSASEYRLNSSDIVGYATFRPARWIDIDTHAGWLRPSIDRRSGPFKRDRPNTEDLFPSDIVFTISEQPGFMHTGASITFDTRDFPGHPVAGSLVRAAVARYSDRDSSLFSFRRYEAEAAQFVPVGAGRLVVAVRGWIVGSETEDGQTVPFYLQPALGGSTSLRGYSDYRFHDRHLLLFNAEARIAMTTHLDAALFVDAGNVAARMRDLDVAKRSYGAGIRLHSRRKTYGRVDVAHGDEGWRFIVRLTEPLNPERRWRPTAAAPFAP